MSDTLVQSILRRRQNLPLGYETKIPRTLQLVHMRDDDFGDDVTIHDKGKLLEVFDAIDRTYPTRPVVTKPPFRITKPGAEVQVASVLDDLKSPTRRSQTPSQFVRLVEVPQDVVSKHASRLKRALHDADRTKLMTPQPITSTVPHYVKMAQKYQQNIEAHIAKMSSKGDSKREHRLARMRFHQSRTDCISDEQTTRKDIIMSFYEELEEMRNEHLRQKTTIEAEENRRLTRQLIEEHERKMEEDRKRFFQQLEEKALQQRVKASQLENDARMKIVTTEIKHHERHVILQEESFKKAKRQEMMRLQVQKAEQERNEREERKKYLIELKKNLEMLPTVESDSRSEIEDEEYACWPWLNEKYKESYNTAIFRTLSQLEEDALLEPRRASSFSNKSSKSSTSVSPTNLATGRRLSHASPRRASVSGEESKTMLTLSNRSSSLQILSPPSFDVPVFGVVEEITPTGSFSAGSNVMEVVPGLHVSFQVAEPEVMAQAQVQQVLRRKSAELSTGNGKVGARLLCGGDSHHITVGTAEPATCFDTLVWVFEDSPCSKWLNILTNFRSHSPYTALTQQHSQPSESYLDILKQSDPLLPPFEHIALAAEYARPLWNPSSLSFGCAFVGAQAHINVRVVGGADGDNRYIFFLGGNAVGNNISITVPLRALEDVSSVCRSIQFAAVCRGEYLVELTVECPAVFTTSLMVKMIAHPPLFSVTEGDVTVTQPKVEVGSCCILRRKDIQAIAMTNIVKSFVVEIKSSGLNLNDVLLIEGGGMEWEQYPQNELGIRKGLIFYDNRVVAHTIAMGDTVVINTVFSGRSVLENVVTILRCMTMQLDPSRTEKRFVQIRCRLPAPRWSVHTTDTMGIHVDLNEKFPRFGGVPSALCYHGEVPQKVFPQVTFSGRLSTVTEDTKHTIVIQLMCGDLNYDRITFAPSNLLTVFDNVAFRLNPTRAKIAAVTTCLPHRLELLFDDATALATNLELIMRHLVFGSNTACTNSTDRYIDVHVTGGARTHTKVLMYPPLLEKNFVTKLSKTNTLYILKYNSKRFMSEDGACPLVDTFRLSSKSQYIHKLSVTFDDPSMIVSFDVESGFGVKNAKEILLINSVERGTVRSLRKGSLEISLIISDTSQYALSVNDLRRDLALVLRHVRITGVIPGCTRVNIIISDGFGNTERGEIPVLVYDGLPLPLLAVDNTELIYRQQSRKATDGFNLLLNPMIYHPELVNFVKPCVSVELTGGGFADGEDILNFKTVSLGDVTFQMGGIGDEYLLRNDEIVGSFEFPTTTSMRVQVHSTMSVNDVCLLLNGLIFQNNDPKVKAGVRSYVIKVTHASTNADNVTQVGRVKINVSVSGPLLWAPPYTYSTRFVSPSSTGNAGATNPINSKIVVNTMEGDYIFGKIYVEIVSGYTWENNEDQLILKLNTNELELTKDNELWSVHSNHKGFIAKVISEDNRMVFQLDKTRSRVTGKILQTIFRSVHYDNNVCSHSNVQRLVEFVVLEDSVDMSELSVVRTIVNVTSKSEPTILDLPNPTLSYVLSQPSNGVRIADTATLTSTTELNFSVQSFMRVELLSQPSPTDALTLAPTPGGPLQLIEDKGTLTWQGRDVAQVLKGKTEGGLGKHMFQLTFVGAPIAAVEAIVRSIVFHSTAKKDRFPMKKIQISLKSSQHVSTTRGVVSIALHEVLIDTLQTVIKLQSGTRAMVPFSQFLKINPNVSYSEATVSVSFCKTAAQGITPHLPSEQDTLFFQYQDKNMKFNRNEIVSDKTVLARISDACTQHTVDLTFVKGKLSEKNAAAVIRGVCLETSAPAGKNLAIKVSLLVPQVGQSEVVVYVCVV